MSDCSHNCGECAEDCEKRDLHENLRAGCSVKKVIGIISGKGGVGKSLVTALLASKFVHKGKRVAILDADITGPSIPMAFGVEGEKAEGDKSGAIFPVKSAGGVQLMSMNFLLERETDPVIWRGPLIAGAVKQFWTDVLWEDVEYMFVDMPPGTGDVPLTVFQSIPVDGIIIVSSPQQLVRVIVEKAVKMANQMKIPVIGLIENMSYVKCPDCQKEIKIFGESNIGAIAENYKLPVLARIPIEQRASIAVDNGEIETLNVDYLDQAVSAIENL